MAAIEYGNIPADMPMSRAEVLASKPMRLGTSDKFVTLTLERLSAGWTPAGSAARYQAEAWRVGWTHDGARHGRRFASEAQARALYDARA